MVVFAMSLLFLSQGGSATAQDTSPYARTILRRMVATYASLSSYQDSGVVRLVAADPLIAAGPQPFRHIAFSSDELVSFKTYYSRPNRFRFEWNSPSEAATREAVIWKNGKREYGWMPFRRGDSRFELSESELWLHLDRAGSSSMGSAFFITTLLLKNVVVHPFSDMLLHAERVSVIREDLIDGEMCYVVKAELSSVPWLIWIGKESSLLRKTRTAYSEGSFHEPQKRKRFIAEEIHRDVRINHKIPDSVFRFKPRLLANDADYTRRP
jgi:hypothetical protein